MTNSTPVPVLLTDPGYLFWAPLSTSAPTNTNDGTGKFSDAWPAGWINLGATVEGSRFRYEISTDAIQVAEFFDAIKIVTTGRSGSMAFNLASWTLANLKRAMNGGTLTLITGTASAATAVHSLTPPAAGSEVRSMIGWESLDASLRLVVPQCLNSGTIESSFRKGSDIASIACEFQFEVPTSGIPFTWYAAGGTGTTARTNT